MKILNIHFYNRTFYTEVNSWWKSQLSKSTKIKHLQDEHNPLHSMLQFIQWWGKRMVMEFTQKNVTDRKRNTDSIRAQLCASQGRRPGLPIPNSSRWSLRTLSNIWRRRRTQTSRTICSSAMTQRTWVLAANCLRWHFCETYSHQQAKGDPRLTGQQRAGRPLP